MIDMANIEQLTPEQQEAIHETERNLQIIACAGSGKTEVITQRITNILHEKQDVKPENIVAFTFTEKAADSMKSRILRTQPDLDVERMYIGTIHGFCYQLLNQFSEQFRSYKILDTVKSHLFVSRYHSECGMSDLGLDPYPRNINLFLQCVEKMIDDYADADAWTTQQRDVLNRYISCLYRHGYIDFPLMIFEALRQIDENPSVSQRLKTIQYLIVDEYQDVDDLQEKLIHRIADAGANICVVGDDDQTIYQFRGSNSDNMISFSERYRDVHQVRLEKNFRCSPGIVDVADKVISHNKRRLSKTMVSGIEGRSGEIRAIRYSDRSEQFEGIAKQIAKLHTGGIPYKDMAILVRKGKAIGPITMALENVGIPFDADCAEHFFSDKYFERFVTTLQLTADVDKAKLYECWPDLEAAELNAGFKYLRSCGRDGNIALSDVVNGFCDRIDFLREDMDDLADRRMALDGIIKILSDYDEIYGDWQLTARIDGVSRFLGTQAAEEYRYYSFMPENPEADAVQVMTIHKAKGLEFQTVFLPELMRREFPVSNMGGRKYWHILGGSFEKNKDKYQTDLEDERKLFYVAITRAKENLYLTYELSSQPVSCFVAEAAHSSYLQIDRADLVNDSKWASSGGEDLNWEDYEIQDSTEETEQPDALQQTQAYWDAVRYAQRQLYDYYGTACHFCKGAYADLNRIKSMSPDQILAEARRNGLI